MGATEVEVSPVVMGTMAQAGSGTSRGDVFRAAVLAGITAFDTAPLYEFGEAERALGAAIKGRRHEVTVLTKVGLRWDTSHGEVLFAADGKVVRRNSRPESVREEVEDSLKRLGVEALDLVQIHHPDRQTPIADTMGALLDLRREGKLRAIGVSNFTAAETREAEAALGGVPLASNQLEYNLVRRDAERELLPLARSRGFGVLAYSPFEEGLLAGGYPPSRPLAPGEGRVMNAAFDLRNRTLIHGALERAARPIAEARGVPLCTVALSWLLAQPGVTAVIAGARTAAQAAINARAAEVALTADEEQSLRRAFDSLPLNLTDQHLGPRARLFHALQRARSAWAGRS